MQPPLPRAAGEERVPLRAAKALSEQARYQTPFRMLILVFCWRANHFCVFCLGYRKKILNHNKPVASKCQS